MPEAKKDRRARALEGRNESDAVRAAPVEAGLRRRRRAMLAAEVQRLADDPADAAERRAVMGDMEALDL